jgi:hypothetical protein
VSRESDALAAVLDRSARRARVVAAGESAAIGAAVAAISLTAGVLAAGACALWLGRRTTRRAIVRTLEARAPSSRNLLVTAEELSSGALDARPAIRDRVLAEAAELSGSLRIAQIFPPTRLAVLSALALVSWVAMYAAGARSSRVPATGAGAGAHATAQPAPAGALHVAATVVPPSYTRLPSSSQTDPAQIQAPQHSALDLAIAVSGPPVTVDFNGDVHPLSPAREGAFEWKATLERSGYVIVSAGDLRRMMPITVTPDALPSVHLDAPGRDLVYRPGADPRIAFAARATDDYGLRALSLRYTKVSGSGEQFEFTEGEIPLGVTRSDDRSWRGTAARTLSELRLVEGDMLVYRAVAADIRPGGGEASSDPYFIEISKLGIAAGDAFTLPEQETRYALSQQMLIVKTERLHQRRSSMPTGAFDEEARNLAVEQRMIRSEFVFMLGGEIEDEEVEAEQSVELQAGRLANRGQRDIRNATIAMSQAEKQLTGANTVEALKAERAAVDALQRAFARDRYILRALATRSPLDPGRRLTGVVDRSVGWRRMLPDAPANRRAALLQGVLDGLRAPSDPRELSVVAESAIRIDPESAVLRQVAADVQRLADAWTATAENARRRALDAIALSVAAEARRALADPPARLEGGR